MPWALILQNDWSSWSSGKKPVASLLNPLTKEQSTSRSKALDYINTLRERYAKVYKSEGASEANKIDLAQIRSLQLLLLHLSLLLLKNDERDFATPVLEEVQEAVTAHFGADVAPAKAKKGRKSTAVASSEDGGDKPDFINVLIDILLSLLVRPSNLFRDISRNVFAAFTNKVNEEVIEDLLEVLRRKEKTSGAGEGEDEDEDEANFPSSDDEDEEEDDGKKGGKKGGKKDTAPAPKKGRQLSALDAEAAANAKKFASLAAGSDDESDDEQMLDIEGLNKVFASKGPDGEVDGDSEDELLEKSASYDVHLSNIVRLRNERKSAHKELTLQSLHFKLRICDLIEIFIKTQGSNPIILDMFIPMLLAIDASRGNKDLQTLNQKLVTLYKQLCGNKDRPPMTPELITKIRELQNLLMQRACKSIHRETLHLTNLAILFLIKITIPNEGAEQIKETEAALAPPAPVAAASKKSKSSAAAPVDSGVAFALNLYRTELIKYISVKHSMLNTKFFTDFATRFPGIAWALVKDLSQMAQAKLPESDKADHSYAANAFLRNDCFILLGTIFSNRHVLVSSLHESSSIFAFC